jgi:hypothetical protein
MLISALCTVPLQVSWIGSWTDTSVAVAEVLICFRQDRDMFLVTTLFFVLIEV